MRKNFKLIYDGVRSAARVCSRCADLEKMREYLPHNAVFTNIEPNYCLLCGRMTHNMSFIKMPDKDKEKSDIIGDYLFSLVHRLNFWLVVQVDREEENDESSLRDFLNIKLSGVINQAITKFNLQYKYADIWLNFESNDDTEVEIIKRLGIDQEPTS